MSEKKMSMTEDISASAFFILSLPGIRQMLPDFQILPYWFHKMILGRVTGRFNITILATVCCNDNVVFILPDRIMHIQLTSSCLSVVKAVWEV